ncbi:ATP-binding protein [Olsenella sp. An290]|uniref:ATP-binding protein n=1 Tax=Olsenella sp. An290 TaxID=1965625 RepID=UPI000B39DC17|nr:ATP-binding protein [Olsenella sp. An290]OUO35944.1 ATPase [Olsenella sp. An290]
MYERACVGLLAGRLGEPRRFIQIVVGSRQTGKSTAVNQALSHVEAPQVEFAFDRPRDRRSRRLEEVWQSAREVATDEGEAILSLDEVQKVPDWSATVKHLWDEDTRRGHNVKVVLTGSSTLTLKQGMSESLKGRYELIPSTQWSYGECREAFGCTLDEYLYFGGYPGAVQLRDDEPRWSAYVRDAIIEPTLTQDILEMETVRKPALLRALFEVGATYSAQEISYRKLLGQLDDRGNTDTIARYLELLSHAGLMSGLRKYGEKILKERGSSPRLLVHDTSLMVVSSGESRARLLEDGDRRGHLVETAVGTYLLARSKTEHFSVNWWREGSAEVDFVVTQGRKRTAIEVKSGRVKSLKGLGEFVQRYPGTYALVVGSDEFPVEDFLLGRVPLFQ